MKPCRAIKEEYKWLEVNDSCGKEDSGAVSGRDRKAFYLCAQGREINM